MIVKIDGLFAALHVSPHLYSPKYARSGATMTGRLPPTRFIRKRNKAMAVDRTWGRPELGVRGIVITVSEMRRE